MRYNQALRYHWISPDPGRTELVEAGTHRSIASIIQVEPNTWHWLRKTTVAEHGVAQTDGIATNLLHAKMAVVEGLRY